LHVRRTLDQSHYFMLEDTTNRDQDQVVLRAARIPKKSPTSNLEKDAGSRKESATEPVYSDKEEYPMVVVDQLWLWVIGNTVVSSFPRKWSREGDVLDRLLQHLGVDKKRAPIHDVQDLVNTIITYCVGVFNRPRTVLGLGLHEYFEEAVGSVADREMKLFRSFEEAAKEDPTMPTEKSEAQRRLDNLFQINEEVQLLEETKDIRDELRMILRVLGDQALVMTDMVTVLESSEQQVESRSAQSPRAGFRRGFRQAIRNFVHPEQHSPHQVITTSTDGDVEAPTRSEVVTVGDKERHPIVEANIRDFSRMLSHANASYEALNHLLNLKQKHMSATEARFARKGAEETAKQGNTIMFFTIVTIIFGSLSFVTTFFALNVSAFPPGQQNPSPWKLGHIVGYVAGISVGLAIPFVLIAFTINPILEISKQRKRHGERKAKSLDM
jgi:Mg2+ and Co2+ transporter CorA